MVDRLGLRFISKTIAWGWPPLGCWLCTRQLVALDVDSFKEEDASPAKLQKHIRELSEQLYRNVRVHASNYK